MNLLALDTNGRIWLTSADLIHSDTWRAWTPVPDTPAMLPTVPSPGPQQTALGAQADLVLSATGGTAPYTLEITGLPPGLTASAGQITGTPSAAGTFTVSVTPTDAVATPGATTTFTWTITGVTVPNIVGDALPAAQGALGSVGLILGTETDRGTPNCDLVGSIGSQNPAAGSIVSKGSSVAFTKWVLPPGSQCQ